MRMTTAQPATPADITDYETYGYTKDYEGYAEMPHKMTASLYTGSGALLKSKVIQNPNQGAPNAVFNVNVWTNENLGTIYSSGVYVSVLHEYQNKCYQTVQTVYWHLWPEGSPYAAWVPYQTENTTIDVSASDTFLVTGFSMRANSGITEIGSNGFQSVWNEGQYIRYGTDGSSYANPDFRIKGYAKVDGSLNVTGCLHVDNGGISAENVTIGAGGNPTNISSHSLQVSGKVNIDGSMSMSANTVGPLLELNNMRAASTGYGLKIRSGLNGDGAASSYPIICFSQDNIGLGGLRNNTSNNFEVWTASDKNQKTNIKDLSVNALDILTRVSPVSFNWKRCPDVKETIGYIAQDVKEIIPEMYVETPEGIIGVAQTALIPYLHQSIRELTDKIKMLEGKPSLTNFTVTSLRSGTNKLITWKDFAFRYINKILSYLKIK